MKKKQIIKQIIVVEGKTDSNHLKRLFDVETIETNGSALNKKTIELIKKASQKNGVILFLDPDFSGELLRKKIIQHLDNNYSEAFIIKKNWNTKKIGVNEATDEEIVNAILRSATFTYKKNNSIDLYSYTTLNLNSFDKRKKICDKLNIPYSNNKQLFKRLNMLNINYEQLKELIND